MLYHTENMPHPLKSGNMQLSRPARAPPHMLHTNKVPSAKRQNPNEQDHKTAKRQPPKEQNHKIATPLVPAMGAADTNCKNAGCLECIDHGG